MALDIWLPTVQVAIELKYFSRGFDRAIQGERFSLANRAARDIKRYDFLKDVQRIEHLVTNFEPAKYGFAVMLTNDPLCWERSRRTDVVDAEFHLHDGRRIGDYTMAWGVNASAGTMRSRETPITLTHSYLMNWHDYSVLGDARGDRFRYLALEIPPTQEQSL